MIPLPSSRETGMQNYVLQFIFRLFLRAWDRGMFTLPLQNDLVSPGPKSLLFTGFPKFILSLPFMNTSSRIKSQGFTSYGEQGQLRHRIDRHILVLCPQTYMLGSFDRSRNLLAYSGAHDPQQHWSEDFFESQLLLEPLLQIQKHKLSLFIAPEKSLLIPRALYMAETGREWFQEVHFLDREDQVEEWPLPHSRIQLLYSFPARILELMGRLFPGRLVHPLTAPLLRPPSTKGHFLDTLFTDQKVYISQWEGNRLLGHYDFDRDKADELAYRLHQAASFHRKDMERVRGWACLYPQESPEDIRQVSAYFPAHIQEEGLFDENNQGMETQAIALLEELILCV